MVIMVTTILAAMIMLLMLVMLVKKTMAPVSESTAMGVLHLLAVAPVPTKSHNRS